MVTEIPIGEPVHEPVGERVEALRRPRLRDAGAAAARLAVGGDAEARGTAERRVAGSRPVDVELPRDQARRRAEADHVVRRARRRQGRAVERRRKQSAVCGARLEELLRRGLAREHPRAIERGDAGADEGRAVREEIHREVVAVGPDAELGVVGEVRVPVAERVAVVGAGRVRRGRDRDAHEVGRGRHRELADHPAVGDAVVKDGRVAVVVALAPAAEAGPDRVDRHRTVDRRAALVEHREVGVDGLYVVIRAHRAVRVGRRGVHRERARGSREAVADSVER